MSLAIDARGLRKEFGDKVAVADLTLQVPRGEIFAFLGPNGAGKTTAIKMLLGLVTPTAGTGQLLDRPVGDRLTRRRIGFLPEHFRFHEWLRAGEFLQVHGRLYGMSPRACDTVIPDLLELVGLADQAQVQLKAFSKGMLQRIGLAQALLNSPELVFLDEPTSGLDPLGRRLVRQIISGLREEGTTVFLNSHMLSEVELTCDRAAFIKDGRIIQVAVLAAEGASTRRVQLRVGRPDPALLEALTGFGTGIQFEPRTGRIVLDLPAESALPRLAAWLVSQGHELYELTPLRLSLEDRFVALMESPASPLTATPAPA